ncbi:MAG: metal ABC transporter ATP-binding protein [Planctomycetes bacterium]|nr:metal ABC transporter ATP-binding protein [Planctomycetota bacterium]
MTTSAPRDGAPLLTVASAAVGWAGRPVVREISFTLRPGETLGIVGPNGAGKSTLLRALLGLAEPIAGRIDRSPAWRAGHVPQRDALEPLFRFRAREVVEMFARIGAASGAAARAAACESIDAVGIGSAADRTFRDLSGGQKQRVLIARALSVRPTVLVLDEPTTGMDVRAEAELLALVRTIRAERGLAVLLVTHSLHLVADEADAVGILHDGKATFGPPAAVLTSESLGRIYGCPVETARVGSHQLIRAMPGQESARGSAT